MTTLHLPDVVEDGFTLDDLEGLPSKLRYEIHDGRLVIMSPARLWHQRVARRIANLLEKAGRFADTEVGVRRSNRDTRVADVGVFHEAPTNPHETWHDAAKIALAVEVWSPSSDARDHAPRWYAEQGVSTYWLAKPLDGEGDPWDAEITIFELARTMSGSHEYVERKKSTLTDLEKNGLG